MFFTGIQMVTGGWAPYQGKPTPPGHKRMRMLGEYFGTTPPPPPPLKKYDGITGFDKLTELYQSGTQHEEDQPVHLLVEDTEICRTRCTVECPDVFRDADSLMGYESLSCKDAVEYIDGAPNQTAGSPKRG